ncbi:hypothetical protein DFH06DRAFT_1470163 [Mycena polygramma]|nr:hypothetical protein DFH06DRAFT_1470163 [Mycena polygramma]
MPPRAKGRQVQSPVQDVPPIHSKQLPQELIDAIIDEFDPFLPETNEFPDLETLRSCALVARAFVRPSQSKLFHTVKTGGYYSYNSSSPDERCRLFAKLLSSRPHVGHYVKNLIFVYRCARSTSLDQILSSLPNLKMMSLHPWHDYRSKNRFQAFPTHHRDSFVAAFALASLRHLELRNHEFQDTAELQSMLSNSIGLEELVLRDITFAELSVPDLPTEAAAPRVVLRTLELVGIRVDAVDAISHSFTLVDVKHLHSFRCDRYHKTLFQANARSIRELTLLVPRSQAVLYPASISLPSALRSLTIKIAQNFVLPQFIRSLGNLANAKSLKRISVFARGVESWSEIDRPLANVGPELEELHVYLTKSRSPLPEIAENKTRECLPSMDARGVLSISFTQSYEVQI